MPVIRANKPIQLVRIDGKSDWDDIKRLTGDFLLPEGLDGLKKLLNGFVRSVYIEHDYVDADYRDTYSHFYSKKFARYPDRAVRLLFFSDTITAEDWSEPAKFSNTFIGYSVIKPTRVVSVGRTLIDPTHANVPPGFVITTKFVANLLGAELTVEGFPYMGQDTDVTVCAHSAIWSCLRHFSQRYPEYPEIHPYEITQLTTDFSSGRLIPSRGLTMGQITEILTRYGFHPRFYDRLDLDRQVDFERFLYTYIESGIPVIVSLNLVDGSGHAVAGIGHSSDFTITLPSDRIGWSYEYFNGLIVNDDNLPPYRLVPNKFGINASVGTDYFLGDIKGFIVPLYEKIYLAAEDAFSMVETILSDEYVGLSTFRPPGLLPDDLVIRLFLTSSRSWKRNRRMKMPNELGLLYSVMPMPKFIWVAELSTRELYPKGEVLGEIVIDATANSYDRFAFLSIHYPGILILNNRHSLSGSLADRISRVGINPHSAYGLYKNNLMEIRRDRE